METAFVKSGYTDWKHALEAKRGFKNNHPLDCLKEATQMCYPEASKKDDVFDCYHLKNFYRNKK